MEERMQLSEIGNGALDELFRAEMEKVAKNILDPNTAATKARKISITLTFKPDDERDILVTDMEVKSTLVPIKSISTKILLEQDQEGKTSATEFKSQMRGQLALDEIRESQEDNLIKFDAN